MSDLNENLLKTLFDSHPTPPSHHSSPSHTHPTPPSHSTLPSHIKEETPFLFNQQKIIQLKQKNMKKKILRKLNIINHKLDSLIDKNKEKNNV